MSCLALVPGFSLTYCDPRETDGCSGPIRGQVKVMGFCFFRKVENQPSGSKLEAMTFPLALPGARHAPSPLPPMGLRELGTPRAAPVHLEAK